MNLCRFQVVVIVVIFVLIILLFVIAFLAFTYCIMGAVSIAALLEHDCRLACMAISIGYLLIVLGWLSFFRIFICIDHDAFWRRV